MKQRRNARIPLVRLNEEMFTPHCVCHPICLRVLFHEAFQHWQEAEIKHEDKCTSQGKGGNARHLILP